MRREVTIPISPFLPDAAPRFLAGGGEIGARMRQFDWAATPLGPPDSWPQSLKTAVRIMLTSRQPIWIGWGEELTFLYNDPYKAIIGGKHPWALGRPTAEVWQEIWQDIGPLLATALTGDEGTYVEKQLLVMERNFYPEETYYTFSYSPVPKDGGGTGGIICANTEDTQRVIGERQLALLRDLAASTAEARNWRQVCERAAATLAGNPRDLPFALLYMAEPDGQGLALAGAAGIAPGHPAAPARLPLEGAAPWPVAELLRQPELRLVPDLAARFGSGLPTGAWPRPPAQAALLPIAAAGAAGRTGCLILGLNPYRLFDEGYRQFLGLVAGQVSAALANAEAYEEERRRAEALAELDRAKTAFFSNVSHEFRTPLTLMLGPLEEVLAAPAGLAPADHTRLETAHRNARRLLRLVNSLLDFSRVEAGRAQAQSAPVDLAAFTAELASSFRSLCERAGLALEVDCPPLPAPVFVDRGMWETITLNLLSNAFKFTFAGRIRVSLRPAQGGATVVLTVQDTGTGIPAESLPKVFERFHRVAGAEGRSFEGSGIGLALVRELVRLHGGEIAVESRPGKGSAFTVTLPFRAAPLPDGPLASAPAAPAAARAEAYVEEALRWLEGSAAAEGPPPGPDLGDLLPRPALPGGRVLLADDNADMRDYVGRLLGDAGYAVEAVADGAAALAAARRRPPDLVLADVMMPRLDGFGLLRALRAEPELAEVPVILLSARAGEEAQVEGLEAGADDYLIKPFSARELLARVGASLSLTRARREAAEAVRARSAELEAVLATVPAGVWFTRDPEARQVWGNRHAAALLRLPEDANASMVAGPSGHLGFRVFRDGVEAALETLPLVRAARGEEVRGDEQEIRFADGAPPVVLLCHAMPLRDAAGELAGAVCAAVDITDRRRAEEALREETRTLEVLHHTGIALAAELDLGRVVQMVTDAGTEVSGAAFGAFFYNVLDERGEAYTLYALSGAPREAFANFPMPRNTEVFGPTFRGEGAVRVEDITQDPRYGRNAPHCGMPEGHLPVRSYLAVPVTSRSGEVLGGLFFGHPQPGIFTERAERLVVGIAVQAAIAIDNARLYQEAQREISARGKVEAALRNSEARLRDLLATLDLGASMARDLGGTIRFWSEGCTRLYGWSVAEAVGRDAHSLLRTVFPVPRAEITATLEREGEWVGDLRQWTRNGVEVVVEAHKMLRRDAEGRPVAVLESLTDVTAQRQAEVALREALETREVLLHEVNHRVKNSLQLVSSLLSLQASRSTDPELRIGLAEARSRIGVVSQVHRRLYQSGTHGRIDDLGGFLRELCDDTVAALDPRGRVQLAFVADAMDGGSPLRAPIDRAVPLALIVSELVTNAMKYAFPEERQGNVRIALRRPEAEEGSLVISVADDGVGLPDGFDPATSRGIGMRVVTTLLRQLRGRLKVHPASPEGGAAFDIIMPLPDPAGSGTGPGETRS
ncbi:ATP-binding protein [Siccirubricoccus phaeus]|uniref:ATP-binding protein n=1 Tax=Siccirubricoccus phaeus TaxID=2595053 RepID=UPI00165C901F|nr:ATP-binding protein [Siccirubricoccus phaeus]